MISAFKQMATLRLSDKAGKEKSQCNNSNKNSLMHHQIKWTSKAKGRIPYFSQFCMLIPNSKESVHDIVTLDKFSPTIIT